MQVFAGVCLAGGVVVGALACASVLTAEAGVVAVGLLGLGAVILIADSAFRGYDYDNADSLQEIRREALFMKFTDLLQKHRWENIIRYGIPAPEAKHLHQLTKFRERLSVAKQTHQHATDKASQEFEHQVQGKRLILNTALAAANAMYLSHPSHAKLRRANLSLEQRAEYERDLDWARNLYDRAKDAAHFTFNQATSAEQNARRKKIEGAAQSYKGAEKAINEDYRSLCQRIS